MEGTHASNRKGTPVLVGPHHCLQRRGQSQRAAQPQAAAALPAGGTAFDLAISRGGIVCCCPRKQCACLRTAAIYPPCLTVPGGRLDKRRTACRKPLRHLARPDHVHVLRAASQASCQAARRARQLARALVPSTSTLMAAIGGREGGGQGLDRREEGKASATFGCFD